MEAVIACRDEVNFGQAFENVAAQELRAHGYHDLHYFSTPKVMEVDFLVEDGKTVDIVSVGSNRGGRAQKHAVLDKLLAVKNYQLKCAIVWHGDKKATTLVPRLRLK